MTSITQAPTSLPSTSIASLHLQQTQNSAPIIEHRCLYTHDLRRKAKRWQDGFLRFHTFNKRVMVYDIPRNYIGDTHWREHCPLQDGDELELDRPVLVQVGETVGSVEQDLTGLLEKRSRKTLVGDGGVDAHSSSPPAPVAITESRMIKTLPTQLKPKSLNALLGTPKGRIGRAAFSTKSPHELRTETEQSSRYKLPPAKRQRVENVVESTAPQVNRNTSSDASRRRHSEEDLGTTRRGNSSISTENAPMSEQCRIPVNASRMAPQEKPNKTISKTAYPARQAHAPICEDYSNAKEVESHRKIKIKATNARRQRNQPTMSSHQSKSPAPLARPISDTSESIVILSDSETPSGSKYSRPKATLKLASRKPRRKLIYRDQLPQEKVGLSRTLSGASFGRENAQQEAALQRSEKWVKDSLTNRHEEERDRLEARLKRHHAGSRPVEDESLILSQSTIPCAPWDQSNSVARRQRSKEKTVDSFYRARSKSFETVEPLISKADSTLHDTNLALARLDVLLSHARPWGADKQSEPQSMDRGPPVQVRSPSPIIPDKQYGFRSDHHSPPPLDRSPSPIPPVPPESASPDTSLALDSPVTQIQSSQTFKDRTATLSKAQPSKDVHEAADVAPMKHSLQLSSWPASLESHTFTISFPTSPSSISASPTCKSPRPADPSCAHSARHEASSNLPDPPAEPPAEDLPPSKTRANLPNLLGQPYLDAGAAPKLTTHLPNFKPPRPAAKPRSPLQKSVSDTSVCKSAGSASLIATSMVPINSTGESKEQATTPWSREAWDLFGCGKDGVAVKYRDFCSREGL